MDLKAFVKKTLTNTCIFFTIITLAYGFIVALIYNEAEEILLEGVRIVLFFFFSFLLAIANSVLTIKSFALRYLSHYFITAMAFLLCMLMPAVTSTTGGSFIIVGMSAFTLVYLIVLAVVSVIRSSISRNREKKQEYTNRFSK